MYSFFELVVAIVLSSVVTTTTSEILHWLQDRKKERK